MAVTTRERLKEILIRESLMRGDFVLTSGQKTSFYLDVRCTSMHPEGAYLCAQLLLDEAYGIELPDEDAAHVLARDLRDVDAGQQHVAHALEGDEGLHHQHQLDREVHPVLGAAGQRLEHELPEREGVEARRAARPFQNGRSYSRAKKWSLFSGGRRGLGAAWQNATPAAADEEHSPPFLKGQKTKRAAPSRVPSRGCSGRDRSG